MTSEEIRSVESTDIDQIVELMDLAFAEDPTARWVLPTARSFANVHSRFVRILIECCMQEGCVDVFGEVEGAAVWLKPGGELDGKRLGDLRESFSEPERYDRFVDLVEACDCHRPGEPYWELELIAVHPAQRGRDVGGQLLRHGIARAAVTGDPVYLESSNGRNLSFYRRHGFDLLAEVACDGSPKRFPMCLDRAADFG